MLTKLPPDEVHEVPDEEHLLTCKIDAHFQKIGSFAQKTAIFLLLAPLLENLPPENFFAAAYGGTNMFFALNNLYTNNKTFCVSYHFLYFKLEGYFLNNYSI